MASLKRITGIILTILTAAILLAGCWDSKEINSQFIVTGISLDESNSPDLMDIAVQIADLSKKGAGTTKGNPSTSQEQSAFLLKASNNTVLGALMQLNQNSNHKLIMHHNQAILFSTTLAEQGVKKHLDLFLRDQQSRLEVATIIVDGRADEPLEAKLSQEAISGIFLQGMFEDLADVSVKYRVRVIDFISKLLDESASPVMPIIKVTGDDENKEIKMTGMAIFKGDKMIGRLNNDETMGYIWSFGNVKKCNFEVINGTDKAVFRISGLDCTRDVTLLPNGNVRVNLLLDGVCNINEISGFTGMKPPELMTKLEAMAQDKIKQKIIDCFNISRELKADTLGIGTSVYQKYPKKWKEVKGQWDDMLQDIDFDVQVKIHIPETGQTLRSLEMEEGTE